MPTEVAERTPTPAPEAKPTNFIRQKVDEDLATGRVQTVVTRFPPEPNGYLHIGHAKSICLNFGIARDYGGRCHLRMDDTNPAKEEQEYIDAIQRDVRWLGFDWGPHEYHASDYFGTLYDWAVALIKAGKAYVDDQTAEQIAATRGTLTKPGTPSPFRDRPVAENLDLFERMKNGEFPNGARVLRAKIDMASPNVTLRDPVMYRILHEDHPRTGDAWKIYPMYDWAHGQSDWIEGVTHSICTLEFEEHRPLYDWYVEQLRALGIKPTPPAPVASTTGAKAISYRPHQYEFARLNLTYFMMSKRKFLALVEEKHVDGWDDPRMPTIAGLRRRGVTPEALRNLAEAVGVTKYPSVTEVQFFDHVLRDDLNKRALRRMAVLDPLKVVITNYDEGKVEQLDAVNNPEDESAGKRKVPFTREIYIEREDFMEDPPKKFFRLAPGAEVRLRWAYFITCTDVKKDAHGNVVELHCTYDPATKGGDAPDGRKPKGTIHWVSATEGLDAEVRLYDLLFKTLDPNDVPEGGDWRDNLNPHSLKVVHAKVEPALREARPGVPLQFERIGYFVADSRDGRPDAGKLVFNRTVGLKDTWAKEQKKG